MKLHALVIDDDPQIQEDVKDRLESLGHTCDCVGSQKEASKNLNEKQYSYILLDLEIPVAFGRFPRIQNGINLLREINNISVIVMTAHGHDGPDLAIEVMRDNGARDYVKKPFPTKGDTLEKAIKHLIKNKIVILPKTDNSINTTFNGGDMIFYSSHVEICGVNVCGDKESALIRRILDLLKEKNIKGKYKKYSGRNIADILKCGSGENVVAGSIRDFRNKVMDLLLHEANIQCAKNDIIENDRRYGYCLNKKITVKENILDKRNDLVNEPGHKLINKYDIDNLNDRQKWIINKLQKSEILRTSNIIEKFKCSQSTAKRDLNYLRKQKLIVFEGIPRTGFWKLCP